MSNTSRSTIKSWRMLRMLIEIQLFANNDIIESLFIEFMIVCKFTKILGNILYSQYHNLNLDFATC
ncbi:hypothetical protein RIR_e73035_A0A2N1MDA4_9GLOM [Rhizophagus irregularis DAOM 181602=DAOM 197198]|nr:hypothetical protein RIR_e73035_A0A2N1MDA4_9GLOM [Rhizophagus irregularis DAOM 181602=DAOM 197198]